MDSVLGKDDPWTDLRALYGPSRISRGFRCVLYSIERNGLGHDQDLEHACAACLPRQFLMVCACGGACG